MNIIVFFSVFLPTPWIKFYKKVYFITLWPAVQGHKINLQEKTLRVTTCCKYANIFSMLKTLLRWRSAQILRLAQIAHLRKGPS